MQENLGGRKCLSEPPDLGDPLHEEVGFDVKKPIREVDLGGSELGQSLRGGNGGSGSLAGKSEGGLDLRHGETPIGQGSPHFLHHPS